MDFKTSWGLTPCISAPCGICDEAPKLCDEGMPCPCCGTMPCASGGNGGIAGSMPCPSCGGHALSLLWRHAAHRRLLCHIAADALLLSARRRHRLSLLLLLEHLRTLEELEHDLESLHQRHGGISSTGQSLSQPAGFSSRSERTWRGVV